GPRIFFVGLGGTAVHAGRLETVVARGGDGLLHRRLRGAAVEQTHGSPELAVVEAIQVVAAGHAGFAAGAGVEIDLEGVLLATFRRDERNAIHVPRRRGVRCGGETLDGGRLLLLGEQGGDDAHGRSTSTRPARTRTA